MPPNAQSPVHLQRPVVVPDGVKGNAFQFSTRRQVGRRRIFVQTDEGNVLGMELDRGDRVESVKKRVQAALRVPTDQSDLVFGDLVLEGDLSEVRNDSPVLLTRGTLYRSSSTPCLSPALDTLKQRDGNQPFEIISGYLGCSKIKRLIKECVKAIENGVEPVLARGGLGGAYYFMNIKGERIAIVKPTDEEPFAPNNPKGFVGKTLGQSGLLQQSVRVGETGIREVAAYLLDHERFAKVPPTVLVKATHTIFHVNRNTPVSLAPGRSQPVAKIASFQRYVHHDYDASEHGTSRFPVFSVHRIGILDVRIFNTDRHSGNILVRRLDADEVQGRQDQFNFQVNEPVELTPIDHGLCLPETFEDPYFEWLHWPQASFPFSEEELEYIKNLNVAKDIELLREKLPMLRDVCLRMLALSTIFLQEAAAAGLCLAEIGSMMSRRLCRVDEEISELEIICMLAKIEVEQELSACILENEDIVANSCDEDELPAIQFDMDCEEEHSSVSGSDTIPHNFEGALGCSPPHSSQDDNNQYHLSHNPYWSTYHANNFFWSSLDTRFTVQKITRSKEECHGPVRDYNSESPFKSFTASLHSMASIPRNISLKGNMNTYYESSSPVSALQEITRSEECHGPVRDYNSESPSKSFTASLHSMASILRNISLKGNMNTYYEAFEQKTSVNTCRISTLQAAQKLRVARGGLAPPVLSAMGEKEWSLFLGCFKSLLRVTFSERKNNNLGHFQRLGTSCQF